MLFQPGEKGFQFFSCVLYICWNFRFSCAQNAKAGDCETFFFSSSSLRRSNGMLTHDKIGKEEGKKGRAAGLPEKKRKTESDERNIFSLCTSSIRCGKRRRNLSSSNSPPPPPSSSRMAASIIRSSTSTGTFTTARRPRNVFSYSVPILTQLFFCTLRHYVNPWGRVLTGVVNGWHGNVVLCFLSDCMWVCVCWVMSHQSDFKDCMCL